MKKNLLWLAIPVILLIAWMPVQAEQRLLNPGFETWTNGAGGPPDNWRVFTSPSSLTITQESAIVNGGTYSANCTWTEASGTQTIYADTVAVVPGASYNMSIWVYDNDINGRARMWYSFDNSGGSGGPGTYSSDSPSWVQYTYGPVVVPVTSTKMVFQFRVYGQNSFAGAKTIYIDDALLDGPVPTENIPPSITNVNRYPYPEVNPTDVVTVSANITDSDGTIASDSLYFQVDGGGFTPVAQDSTSTDDASNYWFTIGANAEGAVVDYYVVATDDQGGYTQSSTDSYTVTAPVTDVQLIQNNGFETWTNGPNSAPDDWTNTDPDSISATQEATIVHGGSYSTNLTWIAPTQAYCDFLSDPIPVLGGAVYACSTWALDNDVAGRITVSLRFDNGTNYYPSGLYTVDSPEWQQIGFANYVAPEAATTVRVGIRAYDVATNWDGDATVYVDDVTLWGPEVTGNIPPSITNVYRYPYPIDYATDVVTASAVIIDADGTIASDSLYIQINGGGFNPVGHDSTDSGNPDMYWFTIGANAEGTLVEYYAVATDDQGARSQSSTYSYTVASLVITYTPIYAIQHTDNEGTLPNCFPTDSSGILQNVTGIVVGRYERTTSGYRKRFFVQDADTPWSGMYVYQSLDTVQVGDSVTITGVPTEYFAETEFGTVSALTIVSSGNPLPDPIILTCADISHDSCSAVTEPYEGVLIQVNDVTITSDAGNGAFWASDGSGDSCIVDDDLYYQGDNPPVIAIGTTYEYIRGIGRYTYGQYKIMPRFAPDAVELVYTPIYAIQHTENEGTLPSCFPTDSSGTTQNITGIIVGRYERTTSGYRKRFFLEDATTPWSGIYVYQTGDTVQVGDSITITGVPTEYFAETEFGTVSALSIISSGNTLPAPIILTCADISHDSCSAVTEPYEGMLIQVNDITITSDAGNGAFWGNDGSGDSCIVDDDLYYGGDNPPVITIGSTYTYIRGIGRYTFGQYKIMPRFDTDVNSVPLECTGSNIFTIKNSLDPGPDTLSCWPSPYAGLIETVCGIVTAVRETTYYNYYLQDQGNTAWGAIYGYDYSLPDGSQIRAHLGDYVQVTSKVSEYLGMTELDSLIDYTVLGTNQSLPDTSPVNVNTFTPAECDYTAEPFESELVRFDNVTVRSDAGSGRFWFTDASTGDSIRMANDLWYNGIDQPNPLPATGTHYDWLIGVMKWEARNGSGYIRGWILLPRFGSDYHQLIIQEPSFVDVWSIDHNTLTATFDRAMDPASISDAGNYSTVHGLLITGATASGNRKVILTTGDQPDNFIDSLVANNLCDSTGLCMTTPHYKRYHSGITPISVVQTPNAGGDSSIWINDIFTVKAVVTSDSSTCQPSNLYMNDQSGPPYRGIHAYVGGVTNRPSIGDTIITTGICAEYFQETELSNVSVYGNMQIIASGPAPIPYQVTTSELMAHGEYYESDLVTVCDSFTVTNTAWDAYGWLIRSLANPAESLIVDKNGLWTRYTYVPVLGDTIAGITGNYKFDRSFFRISPRTDADFNSIDTWCGAGPVGCDYVVGDASGNGVLNGLDVTYGVAYFKGGPPPPYECECTPGNTWFVSGDVNGSCNYNGLDITYLVAYFKEGPAPHSCADCPPNTFMKAPRGISPIGTQPTNGSSNGQ